MRKDRTKLQINRQLRRRPLLDQIRPHGLDAKINWEENKLMNFGVTYNASRIRRPSGVIARKPKVGPSNTSATVAAGTLATPVPELPSDMPRRKPGPPSAAEAVIAAYDLMSRNGDIKQGMTIKAIYKKLLPVLERNSTLFPNGRGLAYSSIARHLRPHLIGRPRFSS
jgi:hypothetical protein